ncbi:hypothetical protein R1flu_002316 [Riccia fluitans]|uniref:Uncharacterized protein n=1 Tax=Riccia fluitans TaxID=41844 RepID=A0ABD1Y650_9MARC
MVICYRLLANSQARLPVSITSRTISIGDVCANVKKPVGTEGGLLRCSFHWRMKGLTPTSGSPVSSTGKPVRMAVILSRTSPGTIQKRDGRQASCSRVKNRILSSCHVNVRALGDELQTGSARVFSSYRVPFNQIRVSLVRTGCKFPFCASQFGWRSFFWEGRNVLNGSAKFKR